MVALPGKSIQSPNARICTAPCSMNVQSGNCKRVVRLGRTPRGHKVSRENINKLSFLIA